MSSQADGLKFRGRIEGPDGPFEVVFAGTWPDLDESLTTRRRQHGSDASDFSLEDRAVRAALGPPNRKAGWPTGRLERDVVVEIVLLVARAAAAAPAALRAGVFGVRVATSSTAAAASAARCAGAATA